MTDLETLRNQERQAEAELRAAESRLIQIRRQIHMAQGGKSSIERVFVRKWSNPETINATGMGK